MSKQIKKKLYQHCLEYVAQCIETNMSAISQAQEAVTGETKNTAGDRYETERAMKQRETELFGTRLQEALKQESVLKSIDISRAYKSAQSGALVTTSIGAFFIAISADEKTIAGEEYCIVSTEAPIAQAMAEATPGTSFVFRGKSVKVTAVC